MANRGLVLSLGFHTGDIETEKVQWFSVGGASLSSKYTAHVQA